MVAGPHGPGALEGPEIRHVLDHDDDRRVAAGIAAHGAGLGGVDVAAGAAYDDALARDLQGLGQGAEELLALLDEVQRRAPRRAGTEPRQAGEELDQAL